MRSDQKFRSPLQGQKNDALRPSELQQLTQRLHVAQTALRQTASQLRELRTRHFWERIAFVMLLTFLAALSLHFRRKQTPQKLDFECSEDWSHDAKIVKIKCPGIKRNAIQVENALTGVRVTIKPEEIPGTSPLYWTKTFSFPAEGGSYSLSEDGVKLENDCFYLVFQPTSHDFAGHQLPSLAMDKSNVSTSDSDEAWEQVSHVSTKSQELSPDTGHANL